MGCPITLLFLGIFSLPFVLPEYALHPEKNAPQHETTTPWNCYNGQFDHEAPGHPLLAPCLRFISPPPGAQVNGTGFHPIRIQVDAVATSAGNIDLRWMVFVPPVHQGGKEAKYPVQECRNKINCDIYAPPNAYSHGNPVVMVTGSYEETPWINTTIHVLLQQKQGKDVPLLSPAKRQSNDTNHQSSHQTPNPSTHTNSENPTFKNGPFNSRNDGQRHIGGDPQNSLIKLATPIFHTHKVRIVRIRRNIPTASKEVRTLFPDRAELVRNGRISSYNGQQRGEIVLRKQIPSRRKRRERPYREKKTMEPMGQKHSKRQVELSVHPHAEDMLHQNTVSRPVRGLSLPSRQSSRHLPKRRFNRKIKRGQAFGYQSIHQQSHPTVKRQAVSRTPLGNEQQRSAHVRSHQTHVNYKERIKSEFNTLQRLQTNWHHKEDHDHQMQEQKEDHRRKNVHKSTLLEKLQDLRTNHLTRLNHISSGEGHTHERLSPAHWRTSLVETTTRIPQTQRIIPNYYPIIPHRRVQQKPATTPPSTYKSSLEITTMATTKLATTTKYPTPTAAPTTEATTAPATTKAPVPGRPLTNRERMINDRKMYQRLRPRFPAGSSDRSDSGTNYGSQRESSTSSRPLYTYREERPLPGASELEADPHPEGGLSITENGEGHSDFKNRNTASNDDLPALPDSPLAQYSDILSTYYYDEPEEVVGGHTSNEIVGMADEDVPDQVYDTSVSMDTWGEARRVRSRRTDQNTVDDTDHRNPEVYDSLTKQLKSQRYGPIAELDGPFNERNFRSLQDKIMDQAQRDPGNQKDNLLRYSIESLGLRPNEPHHFQSFKSSSSKKPVLGSRGHGLSLRDKAGLGRTSRTVNDESTFETSASEPMEYTYNPSSDLSGHDLVPVPIKEYTDKTPLTEDTFRALQEKIIAEERVGQQGNGRRLSNGKRGRENINRRPLGKRPHGYNERNVSNRRTSFVLGSGRPQNGNVNRKEPGDIRPLNRYAVSGEDRPSAPRPELTTTSVRIDGIVDENMDYSPVSIAKEDTGWSEWSQCSHTCGHGTKTRHRACTGPDTSTCTSGVESRVIKCALEKCTDGLEGTAGDSDGEYSLSQSRDWSGWSPCSVSCGSGYNHRERACQEDWDQEEIGCHDGRQEETRTCQLEECRNDNSGGMSERGEARRSEHYGHTKRIKCHLDESRSHLPMELYWTTPTGEKITHAMAREKNSKYRLEGTTLVVTEDHPTEGSYHCVVMYGGSSGSHNKGKTGSTTGACYSHPCHHKGICIDQPGHNISYRCMCPAGYEGMTCHMAPYVEGDVIVLSLMGWFVVSATVAIVVILFCCSKQMKKKKMKKKLELDDAPAEKLLAKLLPHIETMRNTENDIDEDTNPLLGFRPRAKVAGKPKMQNIGTKRAKEEPKETGMFKAFVQRATKASGNEIKEVVNPTVQKWKTLTDELKAQRNRNNSNTMDSSRSEVDSLMSNSSSDDNLSEVDNVEGYSQCVNHNMNNCSWDYSNVSSCAPCDLNSSSIVGNEDDSCLEISTDDFRDFQVANAFSVFKGSPSTPRKQAVIDPSVDHVKSSPNQTTVLTWPGKMPQDTGTHSMFHYEPTPHTSAPKANSFTENNVGVSCGLTSASNPWRHDRPWAMSTPPRRGNGVRLRLPPSPSMSVSPSRLKLPPSPTRQTASGRFGPAEEHTILEEYRGRRTTRPKHAKSRVTFDTNPQRSFDPHSTTSECNRMR